MKFNNLGTKFKYLAEKYPNNVCLVIDNKSITFLKMEKLSNQIANYFLKKKFKLNENICLHQPKSILAYATIIACLKLVGSILKLSSQTSTKKGVAPS